MPQHAGIAAARLKWNCTNHMACYQHKTTRKDEREKKRQHAIAAAHLHTILTWKYQTKTGRGRQLFVGAL
jgi:hypothetical protein